MCELLCLSFIRYLRKSAKPVNERTRDIYVGGSWDLISEKKARENGEGTITGQKLKFKLNSVTNKKGAKNCGRK